MSKASAPLRTEARLDRIPVEKLRFDSKNPRLSAAAHGKSQDELQQILEASPYLALELVSSLLQNGYIDYEPLVVRESGGTFIVVEGNRRLAAIRHILSESTKYTDHATSLKDLKRIPALVFPKTPSDQLQKEQRIYLGVRHLFGFREWPPESKARYLDQHATNAEKLERLRRELNITKATIQRYLVPYRLREAARKLPAFKQGQDFWMLAEALSRTGIKAYIELEVDPQSLTIVSYNSARLTELLGFLFGTSASRGSARIVSDTRDLSLLAKVLSSKKAVAALHAGRSLDEAGIFVSAVDEGRRKLLSLVRETSTLVGTLPKSNELAALKKAFGDFKKSASKYCKNVD